ncbi:MAG: preprotein translocase subunit SecY [Romboutsia sp.]|nr:preprotein translocase subunit SecY [Romboutsia sp.]
MKSFIKFFKVKELRKKILFTLFIVFLFRVGSLVPTPGVKADIIKAFIGNNPLFSMFDMLSGGGMSSFAIFALGISPYITASIVLQLLSVGFEGLKDLYEGGEVGKKKQKLHTKMLALVLAVIQSSGISIGFKYQFGDILVSNNPWFILVPITILTLGAYIVMCLADLIDKKGIGNGVSLMIFVSIMSSIPQKVISVVSTIIENGIKTDMMIMIAIVLIGGLLLMMLTIFVQESVRKIPIQYAKKVSSSSMVSSSSSYLPLKLNQGGVMPVIFASTILAVPQIFTMLNIEWMTQFINTWLNPSTVKGLLVYAPIQALLIYAFSYFTIITMFNVEEICENIKRNGGFVPGIRPGKPTTEYITKIVHRLNFVGTLFLIFIATLPLIFGAFTSTSMSLGGTGLIIVVSVVLETVRKMETEVTMKTYKGFLG